MDLQKEREEFEAWHYKQYLIENPNIDITNAKYIYDYAHKNALVCQLKESHFIAWQAAKAKAIPEGFVVVPKKATKKMLDAGYEAHDGFFSNGAVQDVYVAMIEAQESDNESE